VTREELRMQLWPSDTHVNYDANVNTTVNKLRQVLGDSPDQPAFVDTIPRKGYSFVAKVEYVDRLVAPQAPQAPQALKPAGLSSVTTPPTPPTTPRTTIVEYFRTGDQILAVVLTLDDLNVVQLTTASRVRHVLRTLQFQLSKFTLESAYLKRVGAVVSKATQAYLEELHGALFAPLPLRPGGHVVIVSKQGEGTTFSIFLPRYAESAAAAAARREGVEEAARDLTGAGTILLVEDEDAVRLFSARTLRNKGYKVIEARSGEAARSIDHQKNLDNAPQLVIFP